MKNLPNYITKAETLSILRQKDNGASKFILKDLADQGLIKRTKAFGREYHYLKSDVHKVYAMLCNNEIQLVNNQVKWLATA